MDEFKFFKNFKERGEWVEARFIADALRHGYKVLKPWGDSQPYLRMDHHSIRAGTETRARGTTTS